MPARLAGRLGSIVTGTFVVLCALRSSAVAAPTCPSSCDAACGTCCIEWKLETRCEGRPMLDGSFVTGADAANAAQNANSAGRATCSDRTARWRAVCAPGKQMGSPFDSAPVTRAIAAQSSAQTLRLQLDEAESGLAKLASTRILTSAGHQEAAAIEDGVRTTGRSLAQLAGDAGRAARRGAGDAEVKAIEEQLQKLDPTVRDLTQRTRTLLEDTRRIDNAAEAREKRLVDQENANIARLEATEAAQRKAREDAEARSRAQAEAAQRAKDEADARTRAQAEAAQRAREEAEAKKAAAALEAARKAQELAAMKAADDARKKEDAERKQREEEERKRQAAAAAAVEAESKFQREEEKASATLTSSLDDCSSTIAQMTMLEMQPGASAAAKAQAVSLKSALLNQKDKLRSQLAKVRLLKEKQPKTAAYQELQQAHREADALAAETANLVARARALH